MDQMDHGPKQQNFLRKNRLPITEKIIRISTVDVNNINRVNERAERSGRNQYYQLWRKAAKSRGFVMGVGDKLYTIVTTGVFL
jgi:hypothetical protein